MIQKGGKSYDFDWNTGLKCACEGGNMECVKLMIEHGSYYYNDGMYRADEYGHIEIADYLLSLQALTEAPRAITNSKNLALRAHNE